MEAFWKSVSVLLKNITRSGKVIKLNKMFTYTIVEETSNFSNHRVKFVQHS